MTVVLIPVVWQYIVLISGGLQNAFYIQMLYPFMITSSFGMKIWELKIFTQEGKFNGLFAHVLYMVV